MNALSSRVLGCLIAGCSVAAAVDAAPHGGPYRIERSVIGGGGGSSAGGTFRLQGTFGQAATTAGSGGDFAFASGFWALPLPSTDAVFADGFDP